MGSFLALPSANILVAPPPYTFVGVDHGLSCWWLRGDEDNRVASHEEHFTLLLNRLFGYQQSADS